MLSCFLDTKHVAFFNIYVVDIVFKNSRLRKVRTTSTFVGPPQKKNDKNERP